MVIHLPSCQPASKNLTLVWQRLALSMSAVNLTWESYIDALLTSLTLPAVNHSSKDHTPAGSPLGSTLSAACWLWCAWSCTPCWIEINTGWLLSPPFNQTSQQSALSYWTILHHFSTQAFVFQGLKVEIFLASRSQLHYPHNSCDNVLLVWFSYSMEDIQEPTSKPFTAWH
jgi:hypothetical protein